MAQVLILMATYNGERFLAQQMDSILAQSMTDWRLLIRDDGSTDGTMALLEQYRMRDDRIQILKNTGDEHGAHVNFHELIRLAKASGEVYPYYAFSDQDDVWMVDKLARHMARMRDKEAGSKRMPLFLYGDFSVVDEDGKVIEERHSGHADVRIRSDWDLLIALGRVWGCASMFNRALLEDIPQSATLNTQMVMHDNYLASCAKMHGECFYDAEPLVMHRTHQANVSGRMPSSESKIRTFSKLAKLEASHRGLAKVMAHGIFSLSEMIQADPENTRLRKAKTFMENGGLPLVLFCLRERVYRFRWDKTLALYCLLLMGGYRKYLGKPDTI